MKNKKYLLIAFAILVVVGIVVGIIYFSSQKRTEPTQPEENHELTEKEKKENLELATKLFQNINLGYKTPYYMKDTFTLSDYSMEEKLSLAIEKIYREQNGKCSDINQTSDLCYVSESELKETLMELFQDDKITSFCENESDYCKSIDETNSFYLMTHLGDVVIPEPSANQYKVYLASGGYYNSLNQYIENVTRNSDELTFTQKIICFVNNDLMSDEPTYNIYKSKTCNIVDNKDAILLEKNVKISSEEEKENYYQKYKSDLPTYEVTFKYDKTNNNYYFKQIKRID